MKPARWKTKNRGNLTLHYLDNMGDGLLIPPGVWAREEYVTDGAVLMVLCDRKYEADDYIREYREFRNYLGDKGL
jgi:hypothetical protein